MTAKQLIIEAYFALLSKKKRLLQLLPIPLLIIILIPAIRAPEMGLPITFITAIVNWILYSMVAIIVHRALILGSDSVSKKTLVPNQRVFKFMIYSIAGGIILIPAFLLIYIPTVGIFLTYIGVAYLMSRSFLVFPDIAVDGDWSFGESWKVTKPHQLAVFLAIGALPISIGFLEQLLWRIPNIGILLSILSSISSVFTIAVISVTYDHLKNSIHTSD
jgi:hypothetical protein